MGNEYVNPLYSFVSLATRNGCRLGSYESLALTADLLHVGYQGDEGKVTLSTALVVGYTLLDAILARVIGKLGTLNMALVKRNRRADVDTERLLGAQINLGASNLVAVDNLSHITVRNDTLDDDLLGMENLH